MSKQILMAGLTLTIATLINVPSTRAELSKDINSMTIQRIERSTAGKDGKTNTNPNSNSDNTNSNRNNSNSDNNGSSDRQVATNSQQSMRYVQQGWRLQKSGNARQALYYYYQAVKADRSNPYAFLAAGNLLGNTKEGVNCMRAAATLFRAQGNQEGYNLAVSWLEEKGVE